MESNIHYEWNNGHLEEKPVSDYETFLVYHWFMLLLDHFLRTRPIAKLVALEMGFRLLLPTVTVIRKPDFGVVRNDNLQPLLLLDASYHGIFDLCIEALSDKKRADIERDAMVKKAEYAAHGVPEYYILYREPERQAFFARTGAGGLDHKSAQGRPAHVGLCAQDHVLQGSGDAGTEQGRRSYDQGRRGDLCSDRACRGRDPLARADGVCVPAH